MRWNDGQGRCLQPSVIQVTQQQTFLGRREEHKEPRGLRLIKEKKLEREGGAEEFLSVSDVFAICSLLSHFFRTTGGVRGWRRGNVGNTAIPLCYMLTFVDRTATRAAAAGQVAPSRWPRLIFVPLRSTVDFALSVSVTLSPSEQTTDRQSSRSLTAGL